MGKILREAKAEVEKSALFCRHYADNAERFLAPKTIEGAGVEITSGMRPLGVVLAVMPRNFSYVQVFRFAPPALAAGNVALAKLGTGPTFPAVRPRSRRCSAPPALLSGFFQTLLIAPDEVEGVLSDPSSAALR